MMNKKDLKMYEAPACEVVELETSVALLAGSTEYDEVNGGMSSEGGGRDDD